MKYLLATITLCMLAALNTVKACSPTGIQKGPQGPPGPTGPPGFSGASARFFVTIEKKRSAEQPLAIISIPIEAQDLSEANVIVRKTLVDLFEKVHDKASLPLDNDLRPTYTYDSNNTLKAEVDIIMPSKDQCKFFLKDLEGTKDDKIVVTCV